MYVPMRVMLLVGLLLGAVACGNRTSASDAQAAINNQQDKEPELIVPVRAEAPQRGSISAYLETNTRVEAERRVDVTAEGMGKCIKLLVEEGDQVAKGDILAQLDTEQMDAQIRQSQVQVQQQKSTRDRAKQLFDQGIGPQMDLDNAQFAYDQALATLSTQQIQLNNLTIRAPIGGTITRRNIQLGTLITSGTPVFSIVDPTSFVLTINPPERDLQRLEEGQEAKVTVDSILNEVFTAKVRRINPNVESGTVKVTLDIETAARDKLREGAFARVRLIMDTHTNALLVPKDALVEENARRYLFLAKQAPVEHGAEDTLKHDAPSIPGAPTNPSGDDAASAEPAEASPAGATSVAERVEVATGLEENGRVEILSGLSDADRIITRGQQTLKPGAAITVTTTEDELESKLNLSAEEALTAAKAKRDAGATTVTSGGKHRF